MYSAQTKKYTLILQDIVAKWAKKDLGSLSTNDYIDFAEYIGFANWKDGYITNGNFIVDIEKPAIQRILDMAHGPHTLTILKMVHIRANHDKKATQ